MALVGLEKIRVIKMSWENIIKQADCKVKVCDAIDCEHNAYTKSNSTFQRRCTLENITINANGVCNQYSRGNLSSMANEMAGNVEANLGSRGLIDRAKRNLQEEKRTR